MSQATTSSATTSYQYTGLGQRNLKTGAQKIHYDYLPDGKYLSQMQLNTDNSYNQGVEYIWLDDTPIAQIKTTYTTNNTPSTSRLTYIHVDHLNTPRLMSDSTKKVVWKWMSDGYGGAIQPNTNPDGDSIIDTLDLRFPGQVADSETGLFYNMNRYYDPLTGRYTQSDPIGLAGGNNTYAYVGGNPITGFDPLGLANGAAVGIILKAPKNYTCDENGCVDPVSITWPNGTGSGITKTYSSYCLFNLGPAVKGPMLAGGWVAAEYGPSLVKKGVTAVGYPAIGASLGSMGTVAAEISSGPLGVSVSVYGTLSYLLEKCECTKSSK